MTGQPTKQIALSEALARFEREAKHGVCETDRYRCRYFTWGDGPPILLIPGLAVDAHSFVQTCAHLAPKYQCFAYDLPSGRDDGANLRHVDLDSLTADLYALLDHVGIRECGILACSFGSMIALRALRTRPERLTRAVLAGGFSHRRLAPAEILVAHLLRRWHAPMGRLPLLRSVLERSHRGAFFGLPSEVWDYFLGRCAAPPIAAVAQRALLLQRLDLRPELAEIRQPVLLVTGDLDPLVPPSCTAELRAGLPQSAHVELPGCGHYPQFSHPHQLADLACQFLCPHDKACAGVHHGCTQATAACQGKEVH